jgi:restriction system protein
VGVVAQVKRWSDRRLLDTQSGAESLRDLDWREFERLLSEAFRRQGYLVEHCGGRAPDGGVDLELERDGQTSLVQCKHWKRDRVGVKVVRELNGVVAAEGASAGIVVTSGEFTPDAIEFARTAGIRMIDGSELGLMIRSVQTSEPQRESPPVSHSAAPIPAPLVPACPRCGATMRIRTATRGSNAGHRFWGCSNYPRCRGVVNTNG